MRELPIALTAVLLWATAARAQEGPAAGGPPRDALGGSVGPVLGLGAFGRAADVGVHGSIWLESPAGVGASARIEAALDQFTMDRGLPAGGRAGASIYSLTANVVAAGRRERLAQPRLRGYIVGGLGLYVTHTSVGGVLGGVPTGDMHTRSRVGVNGGAGIGIPAGALQLRLEARAHLLLSSTGLGARDFGYLPVVLGVRF